MSKTLEISVPELRVEDVLLNEANPFKKKLHSFRIRCTKCGEIVLARPVTRQSDWRRIQLHLAVRHGVEVDDGIPVRLLSGVKFRRWIKSTHLQTNQ